MTLPPLCLCFFEVENIYLGLFSEDQIDVCNFFKLILFFKPAGNLLYKYFPEPINAKMPQRKWAELQGFASRVFYWLANVRFFISLQYKHSMW